MTNVIRFSPSRLAVSYVILSVVVLGLFAIPLWYMWGVNLSTFRAYVDAKDVDEIVRTFERGGAAAVASALNSGTPGTPAGRIVAFADPSKAVIAGNLPAWPAGLPDSSGTYGFVTDASGASMRIVATHVTLPGGYHLLVGRESARFQSLVDYFWFGILGAVVLALLLGALLGWLLRRSMLSEVESISNTAAAIVAGDLTRRLPEAHDSAELAGLAGTVNGMLEQLGHQNEALRTARQNLEQLVAERTAELARANESLRRSEARFALAVKASGDGITDWVVDTDDFYASPRLLEMCGLPPETRFAGRQDFLARFPFHPDDRERVIAELNAHFLTNGGRIEQEMRILRDGEVRWLHRTGVCSRDPSGALIRWTAALTDVTANKRVEEELRGRQDMLDLAQKAAHAIAFEWRVGAGEGENHWSPDLEAMYGLPPGGYDGTYEAWKKLVHPDDWPAIRAALEVGHTTGVLDAEYRVVHPGGAVRWLQAKGRMFFDDAGAPLRLVGFNLDVTDRHAAAEELRRMEDQLRRAQRLEALGTLAGGIAHDFNNLLGAILGYGEMALRDAPAGSRLRRDLDNIVIAGERGRALVDRILAFSRSGVGERVAVDVSAIAGETLRILAPKLPPGIELIERLDNGHAAVLGDATQIHQVLMNLVTNAAHAMPGGGALRVSVLNREVPAPCLVTTGPLHASAYVVLEVEDAGTGIARDVVERIFDPFFTTKEVGVGTGLGLSLVHGIVTGLGGAVDVLTKVGKGSTFVVYLPRAGNTANRPVEAASVQPRTRQGQRQQILVVDDEPALVTLTAERLTELGYVPVGFTSSAAALAAFGIDPGRYQAVVTDESMPQMAGTALIREVRAIRPRVPIILVSGYLSSEVTRRARGAGADEVLKKPVSTRDLAGALERLLSVV